jgi:hypothetical protein
LSEAEIGIEFNIYQQVSKRVRMYGLRLRRALERRREELSGLMRQEHIRRLAADLGVSDPSMAVMLAQVVDLFDWRPLDLEQAMRRADTVRRLLENVQHRHGGNGTLRRMPRQAPETAAGADRPAAESRAARAHLAAAGDSP